MERSGERYKALPEKDQPQPRLPEGYGVAGFEVKEDKIFGVKAYTRWFPCRLLTIEEAKTLYLRDHSFYGAYHGGPLVYRDRRKAIGFVWRWYRRYGEDGLRLPLDVAPCAAGITGHLYQRESVSVASAAERLGLSVKDVHWIRKHADLKARLVTGKERIKGYNYFSNYYRISLAHLEAYLDVHGYGPYQSVAELRKECSSMPFVVWCI